MFAIALLHQRRENPQLRGPQALFGGSGAILLPGLVASREWRTKWNNKPVEGSGFRVNLRLEPILENQMEEKLEKLKLSRAGNEGAKGLF